MRYGLCFALGCLLGCHDVWDLVQVHSDAGPLVDATVAAGCPPEFAGRRHKFYPMGVSWETARANCAALDRSPDDNWFTHLVVISDAAELTELSIPEYKKGWVGYTDMASWPADRGKQYFLWVTDELGLEDPWGSDDPDAQEPPRCGYLEGDATVHDSPCARAQPYMCECDQYPENPANFTPPQMP